jgi:HEAT repeat protein
MRIRLLLPAILTGIAWTAPLLTAQLPAPPAPQESRDVVSPQELQSAIDKLGTVEFKVRMDAARTVRRAPAVEAVPALLKAVAGHADGYVRFRALVLLSGFNDPRTRDAMISALGERNDRLRTVAYTYFEHHTDKEVLPRLLGALDKEESEFVRPALTRALAAYGVDPRVRQAMTGLVMKGQDFFRSGVIEALGDYKAAYALPALTTVAGLEGPLQDDAVLAMGKIGDKKALETFVALQGTAPKALQPTIAAAICLLGVNCSSHQGYLTSSLKFAIANFGYQELLRTSAAGLAALAANGNVEAATTLIEEGAPTKDPARAAIALALGTIALRNTNVMLQVLEPPALLPPGATLLGEAFDMLEEDFEEERFFVTVRRAYWQAATGSPARKAAEALIQGLEF